MTGRRLAPGGFGRRANLAGGVYGTLLVTSLIGAFTEDDHAGSGEILVSVAAMVGVFWIAHVYAGFVGAAVEAHHRGTWADLTGAMHHEWPIVEASLLPLAALALGAVGPLSENAAFDLALALGVLSLAAWGLVAGREAGLGRLASAATAAASTILGLVVVALKLLIE